MIRKSGVRSRVASSNVARDTPRRAASGHMPATQFGKLAAAVRIASAVISGWPEAPDSPLHSRVPEPAVGGAAVAVGWPNRLRRSNPWAAAGPTAKAASTRALPANKRLDMAHTRGLNGPIHRGALLVRRG